MTHYGMMPLPGEYELQDPYTQGYMSYIWGAWPDSTVPNECPYQEGTDKWEEWVKGNTQAMLDVQDSEE